MSKEKLEKAIETCNMFVKNNASIQVITNDTSYNMNGIGGITFRKYDTSSIECLLDRVKYDQILLKSVENSDCSKEKSSMAYYNAMKEYKERYEFMCDVVQEMANFTTIFTNKFHNADECENYFKAKVREKDENRNK